MKPVLWLSALLLVAQTTIVKADVLITMIGVVEDGTLNGVDLAGTAFSYEAKVTDTADIDDIFPDIGTFVVEQAVLDFGAMGVYDFGSDPGYFYWGLDQEAFYSGFVLEVDVPSTNYDFGLQLSDLNTSLMGFNPEQLQAFGPFGDFDSGDTYDDGTIDGAFSASNGLGDTIVITEISDFGALFVVAVPEPSSLGILCGLIPAVMMRCRRRFLDAG